MWWAALIPVAMELLKGMNEGNKKGQGSPMQFSAPPAFNPAPMSVGGAPDPNRTASALEGGLGIMSKPPDFGDFDNAYDSNRMAEILRRGDSMYG